MTTPSSAKIQTFRRFFGKAVNLSTVHNATRNQKEKTEKEHACQSHLQWQGKDNETGKHNYVCTVCKIIYKKNK